MLNCLDSDHNLTTFYRGLAIYRLSSPGPNCCLSNELLVAGEDAFLGQHICTRAEGRPQQWERWAKEREMSLSKTGEGPSWGSLTGHTRRSEGRRVHENRAMGQSRWVPSVLPSTGHLRGRTHWLVTAL